MNNYCQDRTINKEVQYDHAECGDTRSRLYVKFFGNRWVGHCHNCGQHYRWWDKCAPASETLRRIHYPVGSEAPQPVSAKKLVLPLDITFKYPDEAVRWLKPTGLTNDELKKYGIVWSQTWKRLILPIYEGEELVYYQARTFEPVSKANPKYRNIRQLGAKTIYFRRTHPESTSVVLVEDILSAIKIGRHTNAIALLGSYVPDELVTNVMKVFDVIYIWLDLDKLSTSYKYVKRIKSLINKPVRIIMTKDDPKFVDDLVIKEKLI